MTNPAKPGSFRRHIEDKISGTQAFENLDDLLRLIHEDKRADYLMFDRSVIVEQKEFMDTPQHRAKGKALSDLSRSLMMKYSIKPDLSNLAATTLSQDEWDDLHKLRDKFYNRMRQELHCADKQIASTKSILRIPDAVGVALMVFDKVPGIMPAVIYNRVIRFFEEQDDGGLKHKHVDIVIFSLYMKDMLYNGRPYMNGRIVRNESVEHVGYARRILDALKEGGSKNQRRAFVGKDDVITQLRPDIFQ